MKDKIYPLSTTLNTIYWYPLSTTLSTEPRDAGRLNISSAAALHWLSRHHGTTVDILHTLGRPTINWAYWHVHMFILAYWHTGILAYWHTDILAYWHAGPDTLLPCGHAGTRVKLPHTLTYLIYWRFPISANDIRKILDRTGCCLRRCLVSFVEYMYIIYLWCGLWMVLIDCSLLCCMAFYINIV